MCSQDVRRRRLLHKDTSKPNSLVKFHGKFKPKLLSVPSKSLVGKVIRSFKSADGCLKWKSILIYMLIVIPCLCYLTFFVFLPEIQTRIHLPHSQMSARLARQEDVFDKVKFIKMGCPPQFRRETKDNKGCMPKFCGRFVIDEIFEKETLTRLLNIAEKAFNVSASSGCASILDLNSGALSHGEQFINIYKAKPNLINKEDFQVYHSVVEKVKHSISQTFQIDIHSLFLTHPSFFSRLTGDEPKTLHDEYWHEHVDHLTYPSFHYTSLLYLSDFGMDFEGGGEFVFTHNEDKINRTVEPKFGRISSFTSGVENRHRVEKLTNGTRFALTMGFTCDESQSVEGKMKAQI